ncbi:MAG: hypothetical protein ACRDH9_05770 [Actinomycetota bacterium]
MLARRLTLATFAVLLIPASPSATSAPAPVEAPVERPGPVSREDILAGRASQAEQRQALQASIELAGGESVEVMGSQQSGLGGYGQALISADLDGDGEEEILLEQYVGPRRFIVAADESGIMWRRKIKRGPWFAGYVVDDFASGGGDEVLVIAHQWLGADGMQVVFGLVDRWGLLWTYKLPGSNYQPFGPLHEINGSVQADGDERAEIAFTTWSDPGHPEVVALDGDSGIELGTLRPTLDADNAAFDTYSQAFVTDGPSGESDEAVFITSLPTGGGSYAERLRFTDGTRTDFEVLPLDSLGEILQGPDYTGDGRRDAVNDGYSAFGVFDPISFTGWSHEHGFESTSYQGPPDPVGDLDADGGEDLCMVLSEYVSGATPFEYDTTSHIDCRSGKTGTRIWTATTATVRETQDDFSYAYPFVNTRHDLNGDGHPDPILGVEEFSCEEACATTRFEISALEGKTGGPLWAVNDTSAQDLLWALTEGNLDAMAGDDLFETDEGSDRAEFRVLNGLTREPSWEAVVEPESDYGHVLDWGYADVDGDGVTEAVVTAYATDLTCGPHGCFGNTGLYVAAFDGNGQLLWQVEL